MTCKYCGAKLKPNSKKCEYCGSYNEPEKKENTKAPIHEQKDILDEEDANDNGFSIFKLVVSVICFTVFLVIFIIGIANS